jgi:hypothetical protein
MSETGNLNSKPQDCSGETNPEALNDVSPSALLQETADPLFRIPVFLSYATPYNRLQSLFLDRIIMELRNVLLFPRTLGVSDLETEVPIAAIRHMILSSYGLLAVAFRRVLIERAVSRPGTPREMVYTNQWLSSPYLQIEPSMAYQQGLPILILVENGVIQDGTLGGILELGATPFFIPRFSLDNEASIEAFFNSTFWKPIFMDWVGQVRAYYESLTSTVELQGKCRVF